MSYIRADYIQTLTCASLRIHSVWRFFVEHWASPDCFHEKGMDRCMLGACNTFYRSGIFESYQVHWRVNVYSGSRGKRTHRSYFSFLIIFHYATHTSHIHSYYKTSYSQAITYLDNAKGIRCLASVIGREQVVQCYIAGSPSLQINRSYLLLGIWA